MQSAEEQSCVLSDDNARFQINQRVHISGDPRRIGTVKYIGPVEGYRGNWIGVDWDNGEGKNNGSVNGVQYFEAKGVISGSFVRSQNLTKGIAFLEALYLRYRGNSTKEEEDEMYVLSSGNRRVAIQLVGKDKVQEKLSRFEELLSVSLSYLGVSSLGSPNQIHAVVPNIRELDLTGNLLSTWQDIVRVCQELPSLEVLNISNNSVVHDISEHPLLERIRILVLNNCGITWEQVEILKQSLPSIEELHLMANKLRKIMPLPGVKGFHSLKLLNLEENCIDSWEEIVKLSCIESLQQLHLNKNKLKYIYYRDHHTSKQLEGDIDLQEIKPFENLQCLLLGCNDIGDIASVDSLNNFPSLVDIRLSENPILSRGNFISMPRFILVARLVKVKVLNGSEVSPRERKESEIRYVRFVLAKMQQESSEINRLHPRFFELKKLHGIEDEKPSSEMAGPQKMASGLLCITLKCVGASIGERRPVSKKLPASTTIGRLKLLCDSFFKLKSIKPMLFLQEEGSLPLLLDDDDASLVDAGINNEATILVDEES